MSFFAELSRRNVIRVAGLYAVTSWLLLQIGDVLLPTFDAPGWVMKVLVGLLALGFVPALVFSWAFELTPDGLKRESEIDRSQSIVDHTARKLDIAVIVLLLIVGAMLVWLPRGNSPLPDAPSTVSASGAQRDSVARPEASDEPSASGSARQAMASIAVLPFLNMSADPDNAFFADGISEELLNVLAGIDGLKVASRTSAFTFKGKDTPIPEIARLLGVRYVLEGSVRKQGQHVRITAQLIDAERDGHLWSETFDRELTDIFRIQEEIADAIADRLGSLLEARGLTVAAPTADIDGYERFLRGRARFHQRAELPQALKDLQFAIERDPNFADAWIYLAASYLVLPGYVDDVKQDQTLSAAREAIAKAQAFKPDDPMLLAVRGEVDIGDGDLISGQALLERARRASTQDSTPVLWCGTSLMWSGYVDEALPIIETAVRMDPLVGINNGGLAMAYFYRGQFERGAAHAQLAVNGGWTAATMVEVIELGARGEHAQAADLFEREIAVSVKPGERLDAMLAALRDPARTDAWLDLVGVDSSQWRQPPEILIPMGRSDAFLDWFTPEHLAEHRELWMLRAFWLPSTRALREDPRFLSIARTYGLLALWEQRGYPPGCRRATSPQGDHLDCSGPRAATASR